MFMCIIHKNAFQQLKIRKLTLLIDKKCIVHIQPNGVNREVSKGAKIRSRYNQVPHTAQDTNGKVTNSQLDTTNESKEVFVYWKPLNGYFGKQ